MDNTYEISIINHFADQQIRRDIRTWISTVTGGTRKIEYVWTVTGNLATMKFDATEEQVKELRQIFVGIYSGVYSGIRKVD